MSKRKGPKTVTGIHIGATRPAVRAARAAILDILETGREEETTRAALTAFTDVTKVSHVTVSGATITGPLD